MTTISATVIADSFLSDAPRLTTLQLRYPRCIHSEVMTHRVFSRNASSSRAVPVNKLIADVDRDPYLPLHWGKNQKGMQADEECDELVLHPRYGAMSRDQAWLRACNEAKEWAQAYAEAGYHKQLVNRLLEPFSHINVVLTSTEWDNFFELRDHKDAEPHFHMLASVIREAIDQSKPRSLHKYEWHLPYVDNHSGWAWDDPAVVYDLIRVSVARCARVSYLTTEGKEPDVYEDMKLYDRLVGSRPLHASPAEHQAMGVGGRAVISAVGMLARKMGNASAMMPSIEILNGNLAKGWLQYRKLLEWVMRRKRAEVSVTA